MIVKDLVQKNITNGGFSSLYTNLQTHKRRSVKVYDSIDTNDTIKPFLSKQVEDWTGVFFPSFFTLSIILKG